MGVRSVNISAGEKGGKRGGGFPVANWNLKAQPPVSGPAHPCQWVQMSRHLHTVLCNRTAGQLYRLLILDSATMSHLD